MTDPRSVLTATGRSEIKKFDDELQIVWAEVYAPNVPDSEGDFMVPEEIRKAAYHFMCKGRLDQIDVNHDNELYGCHVVESFIAREDDPLFIPGSWVVGVHIPSPKLWGMVKSGELNGFSMQALAYRTPKELGYKLPSDVRGQTDFSHGHGHDFAVAFDDDGTFLGGATLAGGEDGHTHAIKRGTITEPGPDGHVHRFSFVEELAHAA